MLHSRTRDLQIFKSERSEWLCKMLCVYYVSIGTIQELVTFCESHGVKCNSVLIILGGAASVVLNIFGIIFTQVVEDLNVLVFLFVIKTL